MNKFGQADQRFAYLALLPALLLILALMVFPIAYALFISFTRTDGLTLEFVGLQNYIHLVEDPNTWRVLLNNFLYLLSVPLILVASLFCAVLIYEETWGWRIFRVVFFVPSVISTVVIGTLFRTLFAYDGPMNQILSLLGVEPIDW